MTLFYFGLYFAKIRPSLSIRQAGSFQLSNCVKNADIEADAV